MGLISQLLGGKNDKSARTIAEAEAALTRLAAERDAAEIALAAAIRRQDELLLVDESDAEIERLDREAEKHRLTLQRLEKIEPLLLDRLAALRSVAHVKKWEGLKAAYAGAARKFVGEARRALDAHAPLIAIRARAQAEGFAAAALMLPTTPVTPGGGVLLTLEGLAEFEAAIERMTETYAPPRRSLAPPAPPVRARAPERVRRVIPAASPRAAELREPHPPRRVERPIPAGFRAVRFIRSGVEIDGALMQRDDEIALAAEHAAALVRNGAAEFVDAPTRRIKIKRPEAEVFGGIPPGEPGQVAEVSEARASQLVRQGSAGYADDAA